MSNNLRTMMTRAAITQARTADEALTPANLAKYLPDDFGIDAEDIMQATVNPPHTGGPPGNGHAPVTEPLSEDIIRRNEAELLSVVDGQHDDPIERLAAAELLVEQARHDKRTAENAVVAARRGLASAVTNWQREHPPVSDLENRRAFIAASQATRADVAAGHGPRGPAIARPKSVVDALGQGSRGSSIDQNYGPGFRRGSQPPFRRGAYDPRYDQRLRPKLPSEM